MNFFSVVDLIEQAQIDEASNRAPILSQIYGYSYEGDGAFKVVAAEADVIADVINQLATIDFIQPEKLLNMILKDYAESKPQIRNRSGRRWSVPTLCGLVRPVYAGLALDSWGRLRPINNYPPIVAPDFYRKAARRLKNSGLLPENVPI